VTPRPRVLVAAELAGLHVERLRASCDVHVATRATGIEHDELLARISDVDALIALVSTRVDRELLARAPRLRVVSNHAVGVDNVDLAACRERGIVVTNTPGVLTEATADLAFALILDAARRVTEGDRIVRAGAWKGWSPTFLLGRPVFGATLGVIGFGRIGRAVARRARGFSMRVLYASRTRAPADVEAELGATHVSVDELVAEADVLSLHAPLTPETRGLLSRERLARTKPGAIVVNTARGPLLDEKALAELLHAGHLGGAGLDVYVGEPAIDPALLAAPRVVLAPHLGSGDVPTREAMAQLACDAVLDVLAGREPRHRVA
jgi:glyoxylate reductase